MRPAVQALAAAALLATSAPMAARAGEFTPAQREEIVRIVRDALKSDPSILGDAIAALQAQEKQHAAEATSNALAASRAALLADPADPVAGNPQGNVTLVEFYDPRCPYCRALLPTMDALIKADPKLRVVFKDLPILGPASVLETRALLAAKRQGGYLKLQDVLMHTTGTPTRDSIREAAEHLGLDGARLVADMDDPAISAHIAANVKLAEQLGVQGTPALVIGRQMIPGAVSLAELQDAVAAARRSD